MKPLVLSQFEALRDRNAAALRDALAGGLKIVGTYCIYSPVELVLAAGALPISLCGTKQKTIPAAEQHLPRNLCPLIKSSFGFAVTRSCEYFDASSLIVAETTCDGKKKMYELMTSLKPVHVMQLPQRQDTEEAFRYWLSEVYLLKDRLESEFGVTITESGLRDAVTLVNEERRALKDLQDTCRTVPAPISGMDLLMALYMRGFCLDKRQSVAMMDRLTQELTQMAGRGLSPFDRSSPRILLTGVPVGIGSEKVVRIIEDLGGSVVCFENCSGYKKLDPIEDDGNMLVRIAEKYLRTPCSCMSPNTARFELVERLCREFSADGVVDLTWQACHTYNIESFSLREYLRARHSLPFLQIETDYSESDTEQLKVRLEAFLDIVRRKRQRR